LADDWSDSEIDLIVADYFAMLRSDLDREPYNKAAHNRTLQQKISRTRGSIEFKHQNISAVLMGLGQPWIEGYKPAVNFQNALVAGVLRRLDQDPPWIAPNNQEPRSVVNESSSLWIGPPPAHRNEPPPLDPKFLAAIGKKYNVAERDARNRSLGKAGEECVLLHERSALASAGREDLAKQVRWTSEEDGDGFGYDIASFELNGQPRLLEIKTTNGWERTPFHISRNELRTANENRDCWHLIRVWNFARAPRAFALRPPLEAHAELTATSYLANLR